MRTKIRPSSIIIRLIAAVSLAIERNRLTLKPKLVSILFCPKSTEMVKHTATTTEAISRVKAVLSGLIHPSSTATLSRCRSATAAATQKSVSRGHERRFRNG